MSSIVRATKKTALGVAEYPDGTIVIIRDRPARRANPASRGFQAGIKWTALTLHGKDERDRYRWNPELRTMVDSNGVYALRLRASKRVVYVGESHTGRFYRTLLRHFQDRSGKFEKRGEWAHSRPELFEVAWWPTKSAEAARRLEVQAIGFLDPLVNKRGVDEGAAPF